LRRVCQALAVSPAPYDRGPLAKPVLAQDMELRAQIQAIALERPAYGHRRVTDELRRRGGGVNHKQVLRLRREDNVLCLRKRGVVRTTDSAPALAAYPNLLPTVTVEGLDQRWVADTTSIRLPQECVDLAVLLDAYSRRCIGWAKDKGPLAKPKPLRIIPAMASPGVSPSCLSGKRRASIMFMRSKSLITSAITPKWSKRSTRTDSICGPPLNRVGSSGTVFSGG
jgi:hypothetical protein